VLKLWSLSIIRSTRFTLYHIGAGRLLATVGAQEFFCERFWKASVFNGSYNNTLVPDCRSLQEFFCERFWKASVFNGSYNNTLVPDCRSLKLGLLARLPALRSIYVVFEDPHCGASMVLSILVVRMISANSDACQRNYEHCVSIFVREICFVVLLKENWAGHAQHVKA
jgi:hypothetical protein